MFRKVSKTTQALGATQMSNKLLSGTRCPPCRPQRSQEWPPVCPSPHSWAPYLCCPAHPEFQQVLSRQFLMVMMGSVKQSQAQPELRSQGPRGLLQIEPFSGSHLCPGIWVFRLTVRVGEGYWCCRGLTQHLRAEFG